VSKQEIIIMSLLVIFSLLLIFVIGFPLSGGRSFLAFGQHFSLNWVNWTGEKINNWTNWEYIVEINFGNANSFSEAFSSNPSLVIKHLWTNLYRFPSILFNLFITHANIILPKPYLNQEALLFKIFLFVVGICFFLSGNARALILGLREKFDSDNAIVYIGMCLYTLPAAISIILIYPREHYILVIGILLIILLSIVFMSFQGNFPQKKLHHLLLAGLIVILITPNFNSLYLKTPSRENYITVKFIESLGIEQEVTMLEYVRVYYAYLGNNFNHVPGHLMDSNCFDYIEENSVDIMVLSPSLLGDPKFSSAECQDVFLNNEKYNFVKYSIPYTENEILINPEICPGSTCPVPTHTVLITSSTPAATTIIAPIGMISDITPDYQWEHNPDATKYRIAVKDDTETIIIWGVYNAADICSESTCTITTNTGDRLTNGDYSVFVQGTNFVGRGPWATEFFSVNSSSTSP
jgi:hypothetical protein